MMDTNNSIGAMDLINGIRAYEDGEMDEKQIVDFFQKLVNSGVVWQLQGSYGRTAQGLIDAGLVVAT